MTDKEELIQAAKTLKKYCAKQVGCDGCYIFKFCRGICYGDSIEDAFHKFRRWTDDND